MRRKDDLRRLSRTELLQMLLEQTQRVEELESELNKVTEQLNDRQIAISRAGTLSEAVLSVNQVFQAADAACVQYLENIQRMESEQDKTRAMMEEETERRCREMVETAEKEAQAYWDDVYDRLEQYMAAHSSLQSLLNFPGARQAIGNTQKNQYEKIMEEARAERKTSFEGFRRQEEGAAG